MATNYYETEVKFYVPDLQEIAMRIKDAGGVLTSPRVLETNLRFDEEDGSFEANSVVLRLRQDKRTRLTFKEGNRVAQQFGSTRFEAEVEVSDFDTMQVILEKLGYHVYWKYEKFRTTYQLHHTEIVLDELPFGNFVEVEGEDSKIGEVIELLKLGSYQRYLISYSTLFSIATERMGLTFQDLTFANFEGITVPAEVFKI